MLSLIVVKGGQTKTRNRCKYMDLPGGSAGKESTCNVGDLGSIPGLGRFPERRERLPNPVLLGFPDGSVGKESSCNAGGLGLIPGLGKFPWRRERQRTPVFWPGEFHGLYSPREKAMAPHSSTLAWTIPWMEEPGGLQSMGSLRVGHD